VHERAKTETCKGVAYFYFEEAKDGRDTFPVKAKKKERENYLRQCGQPNDIMCGNIPTGSGTGTLILGPGGLHYTQQHCTYSIWKHFIGLQNGKGM
jgi:hypothetical protein